MLQLNDYVYFPQILDLNSYVMDSAPPAPTSPQESDDNGDNANSEDESEEDEKGKASRHAASEAPDFEHPNQDRTPSERATSPTRQARPAHSHTRATLTAALGRVHRSGRASPRD